MTMRVRHDGSHYANSEEENQVLADFSDPSARTGQGLDSDVSLGDLIVQALVGRDLMDCPGSGNHEDFESFEHAFLQRIALELRAVNQAMACCLTTDDHPADHFDVEKACEYVRGLARRVEAGTELASRLRDARWGHPSFGGGEAFLVAQREELFAKREGEKGSAER